MNRRIAVVGASGFVGSRMVEMAVLSGESELVPIVRSSAGASRLSRFGIDCRVGDANDAASISNAIRHCDAVVNLAAGDSPRLSLQVKNIHRACEEQHVKTLVHLSSAVVVTNAEDARRSEGPIAPRRRRQSQYAREKARAERYLGEQVGSTSVVTLRPGLVWGPRSPWTSGPLSALLKGTAYFTRSGSGICNLIYVDNLAASVLAVATTTSPRPGFYNVSDDQSVTWREYYSTLAPLVGRTIHDVINIDHTACREPFAWRLNSLKETWFFDFLKRNLHSQTKQRMKEMLQDVQQRLRANANSSSIDPHIEISPELLRLQQTDFLLPTTLFSQYFGHCNGVSFEEGMTRTAAWARYAGFALPLSGLDASTQPIAFAKCV
jgi:2-alkyl-3-oxoalkanoate reductase